MLLRRRRRFPRTYSEWSGAARHVDRVYVVVGGGTAYRGGFGQSGSRRDAQISLSVRHVVGAAELDVETSPDEPWPRDADDWRLANDWLFRALRPEDVRFPLRLEADRWEQQVPVDGVDHGFTFVGGSGSWVASGAVAGRRIGLSARGFPSEGLALRSVAPGEVSPEVPVSS